MKVQLAASLLATALMIPSPGPAEAQAGETPKLEILKTAHDFGDIYRQNTYTATFVVTNRGSADLEIKEVNPSCGCTAAHFDRIIAPGEKGKIDLAIDGSKVQGEFTKSASVETNDPAHSHMTLHISGRAISYVDVLPEGTVALHGRYGVAVDKELTIKSNEKDVDFKIIGVRSNIDDKITYALEDGATPGEYTLRLYKNPKLPTLSTYGTVFLVSNSTRAPETAVQVHVMTKGSLDLSPTVLNYGVLPFAATNGKQAPATKALTISKAGGQFNIKSVTISSPNYQAAVDAVRPGQQYRIAVTFTPPVKTQTRQTESAEMIIHTDDPQEPAVRVQLIARAL